MRFHVFSELVSFVDHDSGRAEILNLMMFQDTFIYISNQFYSQKRNNYALNFVPYVPSFYLFLYDYLSVCHLYTNFLFIFVSRSVSRCNPSRYLSGRCGGTTRIGVLVGGKFLSFFFGFLQKMLVTITSPLV